MFKEKFEKAKIKAKEIWSKYQDEIVLGGALIISAIGGITYGYGKGSFNGFKDGATKGYTAGYNQAFDEVAQAIGGEPLGVFVNNDADSSRDILTSLLKDNPICAIRNNITDANIDDYGVAVYVCKKGEFRDNGSQVQAQ